MDDVERGLAAALELVPCEWAQWLTEDPVTHAYRVRAERLPLGAEGYETAHRLGVIGQVFRTRRAIFVADTRAHPLYDPFDTGVDWELAAPVCSRGELVGVLNLEGRGVAPDFAALWPRLAEAVQAATRAELAAHPPLAGEAHLRATAWVTLAGDDAAAVDLARLAAAAGRWTLLLTRDPAHPAPTDDLEARLSGVGRCLDQAVSSCAAPPPAWRARLAGRYHFVVSLARDGQPV